MLNFFTMLFNSHERAAQDQGAWTPVSYGTSWDMAYRIAKSMTQFMSDYDHVDQTTKKLSTSIIASELVLARATPGASVESTAKQFWPENPFDEPVMDHLQWILDSLEALRDTDNPFHAEGEERAYLVSHGHATIEQAHDELLVTLEPLWPTINLSPITFVSKIGEAYSRFQRIYSKPYSQPWDAPETLELALIRRR